MSTEKEKLNCDRCGLPTAGSSHSSLEGCVAALSAKLEDRERKISTLEKERRTAKGEWFDLLIGVSSIHLKHGATPTPHGEILIEYAQKEIKPEEIKRVLQMSGHQDDLKVMLAEHGRPQAWDADNLDFVRSRAKFLLPYLFQRKLIPSGWLDWPQGQRIIRPGQLSKLLRLADSTLPKSAPEYAVLSSMASGGYDIPQWLKSRIMDDLPYTSSSHLAYMTHHLLKFESLTVEDLRQVSSILLNSLPSPHPQATNLFQQVLSHRASTIEIAKELCLASNSNPQMAQGIALHGDYLTDPSLRVSIRANLTRPISPTVIEKFLVTSSSTEELKKDFYALTNSPKPQEVASVLERLPLEVVKRLDEQDFKPFLSHQAREVRRAAILKLSEATPSKDLVQKAKPSSLKTSQ